jgi:hypothetical protein
MQANTLPSSQPREQIVTREQVDCLVPGGGPPRPSQPDQKKGGEALYNKNGHTPTLRRRT